MVKNSAATVETIYLHTLPEVKSDKTSLVLGPKSSDSDKKKSVCVLLFGVCKYLVTYSLLVMCCRT